MPLDAIRHRPATPRDTTIVAELVAAGYATYRSFAAQSWRPRTALMEEPEINARLSRGDIHARLALADDGIAAGFTAWLPAQTTEEPREPIPERAHLWSLFVAERWWGTGLATGLLAWSVSGMRDSGFTTAQLWTPSGHARARAFYQREGWRAVPGSEVPSRALGLDLVMYETDVR